MKKTFRSYSLYFVHFTLISKLNFTHYLKKISHIVFFEATMQCFLQDLIEGTGPINVRPYCYPRLQKNELEKMIQDMLAAEIIQTSVSPFSRIMKPSVSLFSSPVLLVKKKNEG